MHCMICIYSPWPRGVNKSSLVNSLMLIDATATGYLEQVCSSYMNIPGMTRYVCNVLTMKGLLQSA